MDAFLEHLRAVTAAAEPFDMVLSGTGTFRPVSPVVFVQVSRGIPSCEALERAVRSGPVERPLDFPYHPHVTVAHHLDEAALDRAFESLADFRCALPGRRRSSSTTTTTTGSGGSSTASRSAADPWRASPASGPSCPRAAPARGSGR